MHPIVRLTALALLVAASPGPAHAAGGAGADSGAPPAKVADPAASATAPLPKPKPVRNPAFYSTEVTVSSQNAAERRGATMRALGQVVVRLTGNPQAASNPVIRRAGANIDALTAASKFRQDSDTVNGVPVYRTVLAVNFDPDSVDTLIAGAGLKFWTSERPKPILWLAIDDGRGPRLVTAQQPNVVKPLATRGLERGMRYLLPAGNAVEVLARHGGHGLHMPDVLRHQHQYHRDEQANDAEVEFRGLEEWQPHPGGGVHLGEVHFAPDHRHDVAGQHDGTHRHQLLQHASVGGSKHLSFVELLLDQVADHEGVRPAQQLGGHEVPQGRQEHQQHPAVQTEEQDRQELQAGRDAEGNA